ncbi:MAG: type II secretion system protein, partial [Luteolibacter sp.]
MKPSPLKRLSGFTLLETVIAIGVLAVLLTGFMVVFAPAAAGIRKSINVQEVDRLASTLEQELVNLRPNEGSATIKTGFDKSYEWIKSSNTATKAIFVYQYRGDLKAALRPDKTPAPLADVKGKVVGQDYVVVPMARRNDGSTLFTDDLKAVEGGVYLVKCTQLIFTGGSLGLGTAGTIKDPKGVVASVTSTDTYPEAVIAFSAEFYNLPSKSPSFFSGTAF